MTNQEQVIQELLDTVGVDLMADIARILDAHWKYVESKTCSNCKWWKDEVCVNGDSPLCSDFIVGKFGCVLWETR